MDNTAAVRDRECVGDLSKEAQAVAHWEWSVRQTLAQILALEPLHGKKALAVQGLTVSNVADDTRVAKFRQKPCLTREAFLWMKPACPIGVQKLQRDGFVAGTIRGPVDRSHTPQTGDTVDLESIGEQTAWRKRRNPHRDKYARSGLPGRSVVMARECDSLG